MGEICLSEECSPRRALCTLIASFCKKGTEVIKPLPIRPHDEVARKTGQMRGFQSELHHALKSLVAQCSLLPGVGSQLRQPA